eukprot:TRINITY_DN37787_c0_g2_i4.p1 TRINITY_DN37787_c0_g2~~TRINITY_DN37787_c0_g2_i4.p1  ORF type:complete len:163 (+),score=44.37 TRINITY_DN37787_c0_g2_i4:62-490(+)
MNAASSLGAILLATEQQQLALEELPDAGVFVVCLTKKVKDKDEEAEVFLQKLENTVRVWGGKMQSRTNNKEHWHIVDGKDNFKAPNHLSPAIFDFDSILIPVFSGPEELMTWWSSDEVFELLKEKLCPERCRGGTHPPRLRR